MRDLDNGRLTYTLTHYANGPLFIHADTMEADIRSILAEHNIKVSTFTTKTTSLLNDSVTTTATVTLQQGDDLIYGLYGSKYFKSKLDIHFNHLIAMNFEIYFQPRNTK